MVFLAALGAIVGCSTAQGEPVAGDPSSTTSQGGAGAADDGSGTTGSGTTSQGGATDPGAMDDTTPVGPCGYARGSDPKSSSPNRAARLYLTAGVIARLKARAAAKDAAWTKLQTHCEGLTKGTFNTPKQSAYPDFPNVGQGYQGDGYLPEVMDLGLCYRVTEGVDDAAATRYGAAGAKLLETMATPAASGGQSPSTDSGYGIRNYGVGMATGYDWLYPALSSTTKQTVIDALHAWVDWYDKSGFLHGYPISNYFAGYLLAKTDTAIALDGDDPKAADYWSDVETRLWGQLIKPIFSASMKGGGWPEGWQYGPRSVQAYAEFLWAVATGKQKDWWHELPQGAEQARYLSYFAWPSLKHMSDEGSVHAQTALKPSATTVASLAMMLEYNCDRYAPYARSFASDLAATNGDSGDPWQAFLLWDGSLAQTSYTTQPLSYFAAGPSHVAMRSSWQKDAVAAQFVSGTYIDSPDSGEQSFDSGNLVIVQGDTPIIANPTGWLAQAAGNAGESFAYADSYGSGAQRLLMNGFFVSGAKQIPATPTQASAHVERYEEGGVYARARGVKLEGMYSGQVSQVTRDLAFVRPGVFVVYDRTTVTSGGDQWVSWHTAGAPVSATTADASQRRYDVQMGGATIGSVRTLLPRNANMVTTSLVNGAAYRIESHAASPTPTADWLTVVTAGGAVPEQTRLSASDGNVTTGDVVGVNVLSTKNAVVLFNADHAGAATTSTLTYAVRPTADADHVLFDMAPSTTGYSVTATASGGTVTVHVQPGGPVQVSSNGTLVFGVHANGGLF